VLVIDIQTAVREIVTATRRRTKRDPTAYPFFFIVGAGISAPMIPIASAIVNKCHKEAENERLPVPEESTDPMQRYERILTLVYPSAEERREFFHQLIHDARISPSNLRLAHLLETRLLTNLVLTPNFDEMLARALRLFGTDVVICDHPKTTQRINPNRADLIQIVHVHGTHWFYDCCNLTGEIELRAEVDDSENIGMANLVNRILDDRSPIVVGYSGWPRDVIMTALFRSLRQTSRPHNLYWFVYQREEADKLPDWLRNHASVRIVAPDASTVLDARAIFEALITSLQAKSPRITSDPLAFFADELEAALSPVTKDEGIDIYLIQQVIGRVRAAVDLERREAEKQSEAAQTSTRYLSEVTDAIRLSAYEQAVVTGHAIDLAALTTTQLEELVHGLETIWKAQRMERPDLAMNAARSWQQAAEKLLDREPDVESRQLNLVKAMNAIAVCLRRLGENDESFAIYDEIENRFGGSLFPSVKARLAKSSAGRLFSLAESGRRSEAKELLAKLLEQYRGTALVDEFDEIRTFLMWQTKERDEIDELDALWRKYKDDSDVDRRDIGLRARLYYALALIGDRRDEAERVLDELIAMRTEKFFSAWAMYYKAHLLRGRGETVAALELFQLIRSTYRLAQAVDLRELVAAAREYEMKLIAAKPSSGSESHDEIANGSEGSD
jgi:tetratricopeptide (TPR) repeat protein